MRKFIKGFIIWMILAVAFMIVESPIFSDFFVQAKEQESQTILQEHIFDDILIYANSGESQMLA